MNSKQHKYETIDGLIQSNSIQSQLTVLSSQRDSYIREKIEAKKEFDQVEIDHQYIKGEHGNLIESNHQAKEKLGQKVEKLSMLKEEESRLLRLTENELHAIHNCTDCSKNLEKKKFDVVRQHTTEIDSLNFELAALLERRIEKKIERCVTVRSVETIITPEFKKALLKNNKPQLLNQRKDLYESIEFLKSASEKRKKYIGLLGKFHGARLQKLQAKYSDSRTSIGSLHRNSKILPTHNALFYGPSNEK